MDKTQGVRDVETFTKDEVLGRKELKLDEVLNPKYLVIESIEIFWHGGRAYSPVRYKSIPYKRQRHTHYRGVTYDRE